jgi:chlorobactene glucosyltransferase
VTSALKQNYPNFEVLVLNDNSTDGTTQILDKLSGIINNLHHLKGEAKPNDWLGKPWACHHLSTHAKGKYLIFIDADVCGSVNIDNTVDVNIEVINGHRNVFF